MTTRTYDPQKVQIILGAAPVSGFAEDTFVSVEQDEPNFSAVAGADGEVARARRAARMATMTLTLMQTATFNAIMSGLEATEVIFPVLIKDGATLLAAGEGWVERPAPFERGAEVGDTEWTLTLAKWKPFHGGNP